MRQGAAFRSRNAWVSVPPGMRSVSEGISPSKEIMHHGSVAIPPGRFYVIPPLGASSDAAYLVPLGIFSRYDAPSIRLC